MEHTVIPDMIQYIGPAAVTGLAAVIVAAIGFFKVRELNQENEMVRRELNFQQTEFGFEDLLHEWGSVHHELERLMEQTEIDRFLMMRAWNGEGDPQWTTAFFQMREAEQQSYSYIHFELDSDYIHRLHDLKVDGMHLIRTAELPESNIKRIYELEGVTSSAWFLIGRDKLKDSNSAAITYCSFATHSVEHPISPTTITRCRLIVSRLRSLKTPIHNV